ncbi:MAG: thioredoxin [Acidimicrobiales bacterium]
MATVALTKETFESTVESNDVVLVDFWADWCGPCKMFAPVYEESSKENTDMVFGKVDTEAQQELASAFGIMSIPTLMIFKEQVLVFSQAGALPKHALTELIGKVRELDMDMVRERLAEAEKAKA